MLNPCHMLCSCNQLFKFLNLIEIHKRILNEIHPRNTTELRGGIAKFHCWVQSPPEPEVEWLKLLPASSIPQGQLHSNASLIIADEQYQSEYLTIVGKQSFQCILTLRTIYLEIALPSERLIAKDEGTYLKSLILNPLYTKDEGLYVCLAVNRFGYNLGKTQLTVKLSNLLKKAFKIILIVISVLWI